MSELVFNEISLRTVVANNSHAISLWKVFFEICDAVSVLKFGLVRLITQDNFLNETFDGLAYTLHDFLRTVPKDDKKRFLSYIAQAPSINDNPYYRLQTVEVAGFGHAYETEKVVISINNLNNWSQNSYAITRDYLLVDPNLQIRSQQKDVRHLPNIAQVAPYAPYFYKQAVDKATLNLSGIRTIDFFWQERTRLYGQLDFSLESENMLLKFGSVNEPTFIKAARYFEKLNLHLLEAAAGRKDFDDFPGDISNDTPNTIKKYKEERTFTLPSGKKDAFSLHAKLGNLRIYLYPDAETGRVTIGHVGNHLRTTTFTKV